MEQNDTQKIQEPAVNAAGHDAQPGEAMSKEVKDFLLICNLLPLAQMVICFIPGVNVIAPLIFWNMKKDLSPEINQAGKDIINFQIIFLIAFLANILLSFVYIGILTGPLVFIAWIVFIILPVIKISNGEKFKYPFNYVFIK